MIDLNLNDGIREKAAARSRKFRWIEQRIVAFGLLPVLLAMEVKAGAVDKTIDNASRMPIPNAETSLIRMDGQLTEPAWSRARAIRTFSFPWATRPAPATEFRSFVEGSEFFFSFDVGDDDVVVSEGFADESVVDREDRVELFFARDDRLARYFCLEIDPLGRVHDYEASHYRRFDSGWRCEGLTTAATRSPAGYTVEGSLPLATLAALTGTAAEPGDLVRLGVFRAEFRHGATGDSADNWISWISPDAVKPDFHVPTAFGRWRLSVLAPAAAGRFPTRGVVLVPEDLGLADWPDRARQAGLTTLALHHGTSPSAVADFVESTGGQDFLSRAARLGLQVEYELHAMSALLPRELFAPHPEYFRMNESGQRVPDANLCVHSPEALEVVASNALALARRLSPTTGRYFFWGDDGQPWCRCPRCVDYPESDQALILENRLIQALRRRDSGAQLAHLAYANTLKAPLRVKPEPGIFLEFAPIQRRYDVPYDRQTGPEARDTLRALEENLRVFPADTAQVLEYWLDVSRFSKWKRPAVELPWRSDVLRADLEAYARLGLRHVTSFAVWIDADYSRRFGVPAAIAEYGKALLDTP